jgi:glutamate-1-semialdehyde 2,1-aminomutase
VTTTPGALAARAAQRIPGGTSTGSKRPAALWGADDTGLPTHYARAAGCRVTLPDGRELVDLTMALGAVALGYAHPEVTERAVAALRAGPVAGLAHPAEAELAERLGALVPCAEQARMMKSGAEAVAAAVRIARTATGRAHVVASGYFGWLDWAGDAAGIPAGAHADVTRVPPHDVAALEAAVSAHAPDLAAIVIEPVVERAPDPAWLATARALATRHGAVLVFDEIKTGVRTHLGGWQAVSGVIPDMAVLGKALANGFPLGVVVGRRAVMEAATRTWISSTLAGEATALAAALATLDVAERETLPARLAAAGTRLRALVDAALASAGVPGVRTEGIAPFFFVRFDDAARERRWLAALAAHGVLAKRGPYCFAALAHDDAALAAVERAAHAAAQEAAA